jgi:predicted membrane protein
MNPYENVNPALQWLFEHPRMIILFTILWMLWVAAALAFICVQLFKHNEREELKKIMQKFEDEKQEREKKANPFKTETPQNQDSRVLPRA